MALEKLERLLQRTEDDREARREELHSLMSAMSEASDAAFRSAVAAVESFQAGASTALERESTHFFERGEQSLAELIIRATKSLDTLLENAKSELAEVLALALSGHSDALEAALDQTVALAAGTVERHLAPSFSLIRRSNGATTAASLSLESLRDNLATLNLEQTATAEATRALLDVSIRRLINESDRWETLKREREELKADWNRSRTDASFWTAIYGRRGKTYSGTALVALGQLLGVELYEEPRSAEATDGHRRPVTVAAVVADRLLNERHAAQYINLLPTPA
ncbi:hypothetical protein ACQY0O_001057 [Thecaphora frezii]